MLTALRHLLAENPMAVVVGIVTVLSLSTLIAFQATVPATFSFLGLLAGGAAVGWCWRETRNAIAAAFLAGWTAYFLGSVAFVSSSSIAAGYSADRVAAEIGAGVFVGLVFGMVAGGWAAGGGILGTFFRRRLRAR
ncbi:MAG TPA: hypothetical protein VF992_08925 [Thermoplasmata archaeon]